jgi:hypothetical protein
MQGASKLRHDQTLLRTGAGVAVLMIRERAGPRPAAERRSVMRQRNFIAPFALNKYCQRRNSC